MDISIRQGESGDLARLVDIYNYYVTETHVTFDTEPFAIGERTQWFTQFSATGPYRLIVAERAGEVVGYACSTSFRGRAGYRTSVESSVYVDKEHTGRGVGGKLLAVLVEQLVDAAGVHRAYGGIALPNPASITLHENLGFTKVGTYTEVGYKLDRYWDVSWYEKDTAS